MTGWTPEISILIPANNAERKNKKWMGIMVDKKFSKYVQKSVPKEIYKIFGRKERKKGSNCFMCDLVNKAGTEDENK